MVNLGNAWHIPENPEPRGRGGMRDPIGALVPGMDATLISGNQFQGDGNPGDQLQVGSALRFRRAGDGAWQKTDLAFDRAENNNKYYAATIPAPTTAVFAVGDVIQYYLCVAYADHDTTFVYAGGQPSAVTGDETVAQATPFTFRLQNPADHGLWESVVTLPNAAIHTHVLPDGRVLMWGRRDHPTDTLDEHVCTPFVWDPADPTEPGDLLVARTVSTPQPALAGGTTVNLFCSGHAFLPDGRLLVGGGHLADGDGVNQAALYQTEAGASRAGVWSATGLMNKGRWYPTATTLPDGRALMLGGQYKINGTGDSLPNMTPQVWDNGAWIALVDAPHELVLDNYPRVHVASDGRVLVSGPLQQSWWLDTAGGGRWEKATFAREAQRDYAPAVMYDVDKVIYLGGGGDPSKSNRVEIIDLGAASPTWERPQPGGDMNFPRRQHNATLLPDGTVLVTGGTRGGGFNDLAAGQPVHLAELWNPADSTWAILAAEEMDRCYHATAVLLPDATVLSAGGGEFKDGDQPNDPLDTHRNAQIFRPPYLFNGNRPEITDAPPAVGYGENFDVPTPQSADIGKVTWLRLPSVTHAFDQSQRINFLEFQAQAGSLRVTAPRSPNVCPPGHYMLFILTKGGVPSIAKTVEIRLAPSPTLQPIEALTARSFPPSSHREDQVHQDPHARRAGIVAAAEGAAVVVGITSICPYGLGACWGGAHEALTQLDGVQLVSPIASADDSTAEVFLGDDRLPALVLWTEQFNRIVDGRYVLRGVEMTLHGAVSALDGGIVLAGAGRRPSVHLVPVRDGEKIQWDHNARTIKPLEPDEADAYERLNHALDDAPDGQTVTVTGPLTMTDRRFQLHVRRFSGD